MTRNYKVAGHTFAVSGSEELFEQMGNYEPFRCEGGEPLFTLTECSGVVPEYTEVFRQEHLHDIKESMKYEYERYKML